MLEKASFVLVSERAKLKRIAGFLMAMITTLANTDSKPGYEAA